MRPAFYGKAGSTDMTCGYRCYSTRKKKHEPVSTVIYGRVVRAYCRRLAGKLEKDGMVQLPCGIGLLSAAFVRRKPRYRDGRFLGIGMYDPRTGKYDGTTEAFSIVLFPDISGTQNLRCYGFVCNSRLFRRMKKAWTEGTCAWRPARYDDDMI